jgi:hypothetical protein
MRCSRLATDQAEARRSPITSINAVVSTVRGLAETWIVAQPVEWFYLGCLLSNVLN